MKDALIIGKGPAGISCSLYLKRYGLDPVVVGINGGSLEKAHVIENYYGIESITGVDLVNAGINQAKRLGIDVITDEIVSIEYDGVKFTSIGVNNTYESKTVVIATGSQTATHPMFDGYNNVSYCATCDGFFYRKKKVAIIGNTSYMLHELEVLKNICKEVVLFTNGKELECEVTGVEIITSKIKGLTPKEDNPQMVGKIETVDGSYEVGGVFVAIGRLGSFQIAKHLGLALDGVKIKIDDSFSTNIPGIYSCGDCVGGLLQVSKAVSDGAICATSIKKYLGESK